jgi:hypothetical protein
VRQIIFWDKKNRELSPSYRKVAHLTKDSIADTHDKVNTWSRVTLNPDKADFIHLFWIWSAVIICFSTIRRNIESMNKNYKQCRHEFTSMKCPPKHIVTVQPSPYVHQLKKSATQQSFSNSNNIKTCIRLALWIDGCCN